MFNIPEIVDELERLPQNNYGISGSSMRKRAKKLGKRRYNICMAIGASCNRSGRDILSQIINEVNRREKEGSQKT